MIVRGRSALGGEILDVEISGETIRSVSARGSGASDDLPWIASGFTDLQVNGLRGVDYSSERLEAEDVLSVVRALAASGTTQHVPTIVTGPRERISRNLKVIARACAGIPLVGRAVAGMHVEGPFISAEDGPRGVHPRSFVRDPDFEEFAEWQEAAEGAIRYVTLAPERPGALPFIERVVATGVRVAIGHTAARPEEIREAISAGATLSTHLGNGSHRLLPRHPNYLWEQLAADELAAGIICDGFHLPGSVVKAMSRVKPAGKLFLVSDVAVHAGRPPGRYAWLDSEVEVYSDGHIGAPAESGASLAGAGHLLDRGVAQFVAMSGLGLREGVLLATEVPAGLLGRRARIEAGAEANLVLFAWRPGESKLTVKACIIAGEEVYAA